MESSMASIFFLQKSSKKVLIEGLSSDKYNSPGNNPLNHYSMQFHVIYHCSYNIKFQNLKELMISQIQPLTELVLQGWLVIFFHLLICLKGMDSVYLKKRYIFIKNKHKEVMFNTF